MGFPSSSTKKTLKGFGPMRAQQAGQTRRIGMLMAFPKGDREGQAWAAAFREELQKIGWTEDRNIQIDYGWAGAELRQQIAKQLVEQQPDLIVTQNTPTTQAVIRYTHTIPIIFANVADPSGFVASFSRPGGKVSLTPSPKILWPRFAIYLNVRSQILGSC
jgi:putative tryptophan/tyrosine transport system substrate-binding protein